MTDKEGLQGLVNRLCQLSLFYFHSSLNYSFTI